MAASFLVAKFHRKMSPCLPERGETVSHPVVPTGVTAMVSSPSLSGNALEFDTNYTDYGGELYYAFFAIDTTSKNFVYDGWVYLDSSSGSIANVEMDMNQVLPNGNTVIFGFQCDGWSGTWDYTENAGTPAEFVDRWVNSSAACNCPGMS